MTKEEKIKEAYGDNWELVKDKVNKDGWIKDREFIFSDFVKGTVWQTTDHDDEWYDTRRPMQLKGIEDNNGWVKIESQLQLMELKFNVYYKLYDNKAKLEWIAKKPNTGIFPNHQYITHFKKVLEDNPPIY